MKTDPTQYAIDARKAYRFADEETTYRIAIFSRAEVEAEYGPLTAETVDDVAFDLTGWRRFATGPGRAFGHSPHVRLCGRNFVVRQTLGLDI
jgi:hypothetical protein